FKPRFGLVGDNLSQGSFAGARGPVKDQRLDPIRFDRTTKQLSWSENVLLTRVFIEIPGSHSCRKGRWSARNRRCSSGFVPPFSREEIINRHEQTLQISAMIANGFESNPAFLG